jgi:hypothetical protein
MRPIDGDAMYQEMVRTIVAMMRTKRWMRSDKDNEDEILLVIQNAPTLDLAPVVHGEWMFDASTARYGNPCRCSLCKEESDDTHNYCPNCGAKMGKGDADD